MNARLLSVSVLLIAAVAIVVGMIVPIWFEFPAVVAVLFAGAGLLEYFYLDDDD